MKNSGLYGLVNNNTLDRIKQFKYEYPIDLFKYFIKTETLFFHLSLVVSKDKNKQNTSIKASLMIIVLFIVLE